MAIRSVFYRFCLKKAQVPNVPNGGCFYEKEAFGSIWLEACVKNGWVPNVPNGLGNSKGLRTREQRSVVQGWDGPARQASSSANGCVVGIRDKRKCS